MLSIVDILAARTTRPRRTISKRSADFRSIDRLFFFFFFFLFLSSKLALADRALSTSPLLDSLGFEHEARFGFGKIRFSFNEGSLLFFHFIIFLFTGLDRLGGRCTVV